jgi:hypothetical protein
MTSFAAVALLVVVAGAAEVAFPGRDVYHSGWFNVAVIALIVVTIANARVQFTRVSTNRARAGVTATVFGVAVAGIATAASGLLGPDSRTIVGAPAQRVRVGDLGGMLLFPPADGEEAGSLASSDVILDRPNRPPLSIGDRSRNAGSFGVRAVSRDVAYVDARDSRGDRLTITQPSGSSFLSPVLLMQQRQTIAGLNVPFDSFAVPAAHRLVKAVLFNAAQAGAMRALQGGAGPAVLFAVDDENDRPLPNAIGAVRSGATTDVGGLQLRAVVFSYPAVEIVAVPPLAAIIAGALLTIGGLLAGYATRF